MLTGARVSMELRRVFIVYNSPLFAQGLRALLSEVPDLEVVGLGAVIPEEEVVWNDLQRLAPDVIILEEGNNPPLKAIMDMAPKSRIVGLTLSSNRIRVYAHRDIPRAGLEGVLGAIALASQGGLEAPAFPGAERR